MSENNQMMSVEGQLVGMPLAGPESFSQQQLDYLKRALGVDETVLFENSATGTQGSHSISLSESLFNFDHAIFYVSDDAGTYGVIIVPTSVNATSGSCMIRWTGGYRTLYVTTSNGTDWAINGYQWYGSGGGEIGSNYLSINKVVGVHRIAGGNT